MLKRDFLDPLGLDDAGFAAHIGLGRERLRRLLAGAEPLDADACVRFARALGLSAERLMQMQVRYDFAAARKVAELNRLKPISPRVPPAFPETGFRSGRLGRTPDGFGEGSLFFQEDVVKRFPRDAYAGLHALWRGDRLRVYDPGGVAIWTGPLLQDLDGHFLLPYERPTVWHGWFAAGYRAHLAIGEEHAAFFERMRQA